MSGLLNSSLNGSASNHPDSTGRSFTTSFSAQSGAASPVYHHTGSIQGLHNIHGSFNVPNMPGTLGSRNTAINNVPSSGVQQSAGNLSSGRFVSNGLPVALSQISASHGHSGMSNRGGMSVVGNAGFNSNTNGVGGSVPGILPTSAALGNRSGVQGLGVSPMLGNISGGNVGRNITSGGGLSGLASRLNLSTNSGSGNVNVQGPNRLMGSMLQQASPQVMSMLGNSYPSAGGPLSQNHIQANMNSMGMMNDLNSNDNSPFDINDFPQLSSRPSSAGGPQGQLGSLRKQGLSPIVQRNQEFSIQNEDFPALPGFKGGNADYGMDLHQKEQLHDNNISLMQPQHFSMGRSSGFSLGGSYSSHRQQPQQHAPSVSTGGVSFPSVNNQDLLHLHNSDMFASSHAGLHILEAEYFRTNNSFIPPVDSAESCFQGFQSIVNEFMPNLDLQSSCGINSTRIVQGCLDITNRTEFESVLPRDVLNGVVSTCNVSLNGSACNDCSSSLQNVTSRYFPGDSTESITSCRDYASIYAASSGGRDRPIDRTTVTCLFSLDFDRFDNSETTSDSRRRRIIIGVSVGSSVVVCLLGILLLWRKMRRNLRLQQRNESGLALSRFDSMRGNSVLVKFSFEEVKVATNNFSVSNVIGSGGYGNVYKGVLLDGSEVAFKRFKKLSEDGENDFMHELEVIASVRHVNLVALRGYCTVSTKHDGYQRIIVCDLMKNGSLHDHLFASKGERLSWPVRENIALGTAKGLAYLHYGVQPAIIHRDIKASNILLDESFEPKVADFGLARFSPDGITHLSTSVAGTIGYVSPEYALYGQLNEKSDVYSFGIVLLELLTGKKAVMAVSKDEQPIILSDWAWSLVGENRILDVIDETIPNLGPPEVLKKYVLIALICSHPKLSVRPTMDQVVKLLDADAPTPVLPERPISLIADLTVFEQSLNSIGSGDYLSTSTSEYTLKYDGISRS